LGAFDIRASLIVLNYQGVEVIQACVDSIAAAAAPSDEIIVVDNASTDGSAELVDARDDVRLVRLPENTYIFGLNAGLAIAGGRYVAFLNNDITVAPDFVDRCLERFADGDDIFGVCPRIIIGGRDQGSRTAGVWERGLIFYRPLPHSATPTDCFFAVGGQSFFRRDMLEQIGSIDPLLWPMYHEDVELSYRAWKRGWRVRYAPDAVVDHVGKHSTDRVFTPSQLRALVRQNEFLTVWKNVTDRSLLAEHVLLIPARLAAATLKRDWPTLLGFIRALRRLPAVTRARRSARVHMRLTDRDVLRRVAAIDAGRQ
jgi:GT2 family glycosyltransferase